MLDDGILDKKVGRGERFPVASVKFDAAAAQMRKVTAGDAVSEAGDGVETPDVNAIIAETFYPAIFQQVFPAFTKGDCRAASFAETESFETKIGAVCHFYHVRVGEIAQSNVCLRGVDAFRRIPIEQTGLSAEVPFAGAVDFAKQV